jgi:hypothetical protein
VIVRTLKSNLNFILWKPRPAYPDAAKSANGLPKPKNQDLASARPWFQYLSTREPANAPIAVTSAVPSVYQVATNSGESSVQC